VFTLQQRGVHVQFLGRYTVKKNDFQPKILLCIHTYTFAHGTHDVDLILTQKNKNKKQMVTYTHFG